MKKVLVLSAIFIVSLVLRCNQLSTLPSILNRDEAALAYNALLLEETGQDEWGRNWPLSLESFGDYKLPGYAYTLVALFKLFPTNDFVVRLPSAMAGSFLVILAFFFAKSQRFRDPWAWLFVILIATTPVFFFYSRMAFEANLALSFFVLSLTLLLKRDKKGQWRRDLWAILLMFLAVLTYNTPLLLLPFILPVVIWLRGVKSWRSWITPMIGLSIVGLVAGYQLMSLASQKSGITIFQDETVWMETVSYRQQFSGFWQTILGNKYVYYGYLMSRNLLKSFSAQFLISGQGGHPWHSVPDQGHVLAPIYFFALIGIISVSVKLLKAIKKNKYSGKIRARASLLYLLLVSLIPAVITVDAPHATRSLFFFFIFNLFTLFGLKESYHLIRDHTQIKKNALFIGFSVLLVVFTYQYFRDYFTKYPRQQQALQPGFAEVITQVEAKYAEGAVAVIDPEGYQYILLAWYLKLSPDEFFKTISRQLPDKIGFRYGEDLARYHFIAHRADRSEAEKVMIEWQQKTQNWQVVEL